MQDDLRFVTTVTAGMDGVITIDEDKNIVVFNNYAEKLFGYAEKELLGKPLDLLLPLNIIEKHKQHIDSFISSDAPGRTMAERQVVQGRHADGHNIDFEASISQITHDGRRYCTAVLRDVTPIREKQESIQKAKNQLEQNIKSQRKILQNTHARLSEVQRLSQIGIWEYDIENSVLYWSDEVFEIFGLDRNTFRPSYEAFLEAVHPEDREAVNHIYTESVENKRPYQVRHRLLMDNGEIKHVEERCETFYNDYGEPKRSVGTIQDTTTQVLSEQQRRHLQRLLLRVESLAEVGSWEWNRDTDQVYWSPEMYRLYGIDPINNPQPNFDLAIDSIHPDDKEKVQAGIEQITKSGFLDTLDYRLVDSSKNIRFLRAQGETCKEENGGKNCIYGFSQDVTRYIETELEAKESNQLLQAVLDTTHIAIAYLDRNLRFVRVNQAYATSDNKQPEYFVGKKHFDLFPNEQNEKIFKKALVTGETTTVYAKPFEYTHNPERGTSHWDWTITPISDDNSKVKGLVLSLLDVSDRINAIEIAQDNEEKIKTLNENLEDIVKKRTTELLEERNFIDTVLETQGALVTVLNRYGKIVMFNRACEKSTGFSSDEVMGQSIWDHLIPLEERKTVEHVFHNLTKTALPSRYENQWITKEGEYRLIDWSNSVIADKQGIVTYVIATGIDVTERRRTETKLRRSSTSLQIAQRIAKVGSWEYDVKSKKLWWSEENFRIFGQNPESFTPSRETYLSSIHPDDVQKAAEASDQLVERGYKDTVQRIVTPDGSIRIVHEMAEVEYDDNKAPILLRGTVQDITDIKIAEEERIQLQRQLQQAQKMESIGQLTGGLAHDFNNILSAILGFTRLAISRFSPDRQDTLGNYLDEIEKAGNRASDLVKQMLAFSRGDTQSYKKFDPLPIISETTKMLRSTIPASINITNKLQEEKVIIETDALQLQQSIINLIINARDALDDKGEIEVKLFAEKKKRAECISCHKLFGGKFVTISVNDTGSGIDSNTASRIFEPFFTTKTVGRGSGMGLAMVHGIVHSSGGHIQITTKPGKGTTVALHFPLCETNGKATTDTALPVDQLIEKPNSTEKQILVVDDEDAIVKLISEYLALNNFNVESTTSSREALQQLQSDPSKFDLLITDQAMPELTGLDLIREAHKLNPDLPVLLCSGYSDVVDETNAVEKGASHYLSKPFDQKDLIYTVNSLLE